MARKIGWISPGASRRRSWRFRLTAVRAADRKSMSCGAVCCRDRDRSVRPDRCRGVLPSRCRGVRGGIRAPRTDRQNRLQTGTKAAIDRPVAVIAQAQPLIGSSTPEKYRAQDVHAVFLEKMRWSEIRSGLVRSTNNAELSSRRFEPSKSGGAPFSNNSRRERYRVSDETVRPTDLMLLRYRRGCPARRTCRRI